MDKFFIQAAFKSLDDIDKKGNEEIKKALLESRNRERAKRKSKFKSYPLAKGEHLNPCAGNPDINIAAFNHATDVGASSPSMGLGEDIEGLQSLEEKLPKDLAMAYRNTKVYARKDTFRPERDITRPHKLTPYDYENSDYKEITKEEALKYRNKPKERYKLRVIVNGMNDHPHVVIFNKDGKVISDFKVSLRNFPSTRKFNDTLNSIRYYSFTDIINGASKIYETDEDSHPNKEAEERTNLASSFDSYGSPKYEL